MVAKFTNQLTIYIEFDGFTGIFKRHELYGCQDYNSVLLHNNPSSIFIRDIIRLTIINFTYMDEFRHFVDTCNSYLNLNDEEIMNVFTFRISR